MTALTIIVGDGKLEGKILKKMHERIIKNFMDIIILAELRNGPLSGYDVISFIHNKFPQQVRCSCPVFVCGGCFNFCVGDIVTYGLDCA